MRASKLQEKEVFFSEEKKQKTFMFRATLSGEGRDSNRRHEGKAKNKRLSSS
jgi:hypothetical protein